MSDPIMDRLRRAARRVIERTGYEVRRVDSNRTLEEYVRVVFPGLGVNVVVDVGAHRGEYGRFLRDYGYRGQIISFEPQAGAFRDLSVAARRDGRWRAHRLALGAENGTLTLNIAHGTSFSSLRALNDYGARTYPAAARAKTEAVPVRRLDAILPDALAGLARPRVFLKMDTQGYDLEVFRGAAGCLDAVVALQSEMSATPLYEGGPDFLDSIAEIRAAGFAVSGFFPLGRDPELRLQEFDCVMVRVP